MKSILLNCKKIRAEVIKDFLGKRRAFCFSSGNATYALRRAGVNLIAVGPKESLGANRTITPEEAEFYFQAFNATPGYLPIFLVRRIAERLERQYKKKVGRKGRVFIPFGSGELIFTFSFFVPLGRIVAVTSDYPHLRQDGTSPLSEFVNKNCLSVLKIDGAKSIKEIMRRVGKKRGPGDVFIDTSPADKERRLKI